MPIRAFRLPQDAQTLIEVLPLAFQYPENPAWSVNTDEAQSFLEQLQRIRRLWPLLRVLFVVSPWLRDVLNGVVWEEDGKPVAIANVGRQGQSDGWSIGNVGVLPAYRRHGIARKMVIASIEHARQRGAKRVTLQVIDGNTPAFDLYKSLGFEPFDRGLELTAHQPAAPLPIALPESYRIKFTTNAEWRPRYELAKRITPITVQRYEPVEEARYRVTWVERVLGGLLESGIRTKRLAAYNAAGEIVAYARYSARLRPGGVNSLSILLDPAHAALSDYLVHSLMSEIVTISPGRTIEFRVMGWNQSLIDRALAVGFTQRMAGVSMGLCV